MLATQPPGARAAAGEHKKKKTVALKNKAISREESVKPYVQDCLYNVTKIAIKRCIHITACVDHATRIAIERQRSKNDETWIRFWKEITLKRQRSKNDESWRSEGGRPYQWYVCFLFIISGREVLVPITADTSYADLYKLARKALGLEKHPSKSLRLCYHVPWVTFPGDENDAICSSSDRNVIASDRSRTIRAFPVHA